MFAGGSHGGAPPQPPEQPEPTPPSPVCEPGATCGCWHQPPGEAWQQLPPCASGTACNPELDPLLSAPPADEAYWRGPMPGIDSQRRVSMAAAIRDAQAACPSAWREHCLAGGPPYIDAGYRLIAKQLQLVGIAASQAQARGGKRKGHLFVLMAPGIATWEEWKLFAYSDGCLAQTQYNGAHKYVGPAQPPGPTPRPTTETCPKEPCPLRFWTEATLPDGWGGNEVGQPAYELKAAMHTMGNMDGTVVVIQQEPHCAAIGLSPYADGQPRASCPVRPDGHPDRALIENWILSGGFVRVGRNGQDCTPNSTDNPAAFLGGTGNCRICDATGKGRGDKVQPGTAEARHCSPWS